jgi:rSAM/selenodomain-associated transferase 1
MYDWLGNFRYVSQSNGDLGDRMKQAFQSGFDQGCDRIVMIGTDCPAIDEALIDRAFSALNQIDVVFGPAVDGGYYLIGLRKQVLELFSNITWSTASVLQDSLAIVNDLNLSCELLEILPDIDRPEDLQYLNADIWLADIEVTE